MKRIERARAVNQELKKLYPTPKPSLNYTKDFELLFAIILSAQSTDERVNLVTPTLFARYPQLSDYAQSDLSELRSIIRPIGFQNTKAKNIQAAAKQIIKNHAAQVPDNLAELITLPGVARKTANVFLSQWFHKYEGVAVDTHVSRISKRLGLTAGKSPEKIERDLMELFPQADWGELSLRMVFYGREVCFASKPKCSSCTLSKICPSAFKFTS